MNTEYPIISGPPRGMRDFYPEDMILRDAIFKAWHNASRIYSFSEYDSCVVESLELFKRKAGEEIVEQIYWFKDKSGRELALRPEMTPTLARMIAARIASMSFPIKWYTIAQCFRYERMTRGRKREHYQWNLDIIGIEELTAEAEVIACASKALEFLNIPSDAIKIHINSRKILSSLLCSLDIPQELHNNIFIILDKINKISLEEIKELLRKININEEKINKIIDTMKINDISKIKEIAGEKGVERLEELFNILKSYNIPYETIFDISIVRGLSYYTDTVFEAYDSKKKFRAIFGGGRYDNLISEISHYHKNLPGVGIGFGDVVIGELLVELNILPVSKKEIDIAIGYMDKSCMNLAIEFAESQRRKGLRVDLALQPEKASKFFRRASKASAKKAIFIGPDEIKSKKGRIKDLGNGCETIIEL